MPLITPAFPSDNGVLAPQNCVQFEAIGAGAGDGTGANISWSQTSAGGPTAAVVIAIGAVIDATAGGVNVSATYSGGPGGGLVVGGGISANPLGQWYLLGLNNYYNDGTTAIASLLVAFVGLPAGTQTVAVTTTGGSLEGISGNSVSYRNVGSIGSLVTNADTTTGLTLPSIASASGQMAVGFFSGNVSTIGTFNGTTRWSHARAANFLPTVIGDAPGASSVSFTAHQSPADSWGGTGGALIPPAPRYNYSLHGAKGRQQNVAITRSSTL